MSRILVFQHVAAEPLGSLNRLLRARGHRLRFVNFERDPAAVPNVDRYDALIVLGGPMNVDEQRRYPHLATELHAIDTMLKQNKPVLGICLGAQLLAHALGAPVTRLPKPEFGWYPLELADDGHRDAVVQPLHQQQIFQWHGCRFEVPSSAVHLARSADCEQQAFRYGEHAYGFQFHLEVEAAMIQRWLKLPGFLAELHEAQLGVDAATIWQHTTQWIADTEALAEQVFGAMLDRSVPAASRFALPSR